MYKLYATNRYRREVKELAKSCNIENILFHTSILIDIRNDVLLKIVMNKEKLTLYNPNYDIGNYMCYKLRLKDICQKRKKGKRGGLRLILAINLKEQKIILLTVYSKSKKEDVSIKELQELLKDYIDEYNPCDELINKILRVFKKSKK